MFEFPQAESAGDRDTVVPVAHEVDVAHLQQVDRRHRLTSAHRGVDLLPACANPARGGAKAAIEIALAIDRADDRVERDDLQAEVRLARPAKGLDDLLEGEDQPDVVGLAPQPPGDLAEQPGATCPREVGLRVGTGEAAAHART